jgi:geranylgeranyl reductase family protein
MLEVLEPCRFSVLDVENLRLHYALTLEHWLQRFEAARERVREMYDGRFERAWRLYLCGAQAAFRAGEMQLFQVLFARGRSNRVPWTRAHLYDAPDRSRDGPEKCDVLVVGGGPAGSTCAGRLRQAGLDVMVMDKHAFPRDKVCAGWITPAVVESLELDLEDYAQGRVLQPIRGFRIGTIGGAETLVRYDAPASYGIRRCEFDHYLLLRAKVRVAPAEAVKSMVRDKGSWLVNDRIRTPLVVGAGGNFCPVARMLEGETGSSQPIVVAQELEFRVEGRERDACGIEQDVAQLYFCPDLKGYGWCVAKGDYLNVGLGREDTHRLSEHVDQFRGWLEQRDGIPHDLPGRFSGHAYVLYPESRRKQYDDAVILIGDAAGLAYARSGEGIRPAVESALMAAEVICGAAGDYSLDKLAPYAKRLAQRFGDRIPDQEAAAWLPRGVKQSLAARLLAMPWFARNVVVDHWFLHSGQRSMRPETRI